MTVSHDPINVRRIRMFRASGRIFFEPPRSARRLSPVQTGRGPPVAAQPIFERSIRISTKIAGYSPFGLQPLHSFSRTAAGGCFQCEISEICGLVRSFSFDEFTHGPDRRAGCFICNGRRAGARSADPARPIGGTGSHRHLRRGRRLQHAGFGLPEADVPTERNGIKIDTVVFYAYDTIKLNEQGQISGGIRAERYNVSIDTKTIAGLPASPLDGFSDSQTTRSGSFRMV